MADTPFHIHGDAIYVYRQKESRQLKWDVNWHSWSLRRRRILSCKAKRRPNMSLCFRLHLDYVINLTILKCHIQSIDLMEKTPYKHLQFENTKFSELCMNFHHANTAVHELIRLPHWEIANCKILNVHFPISSTEALSRRQIARVWSTRELSIATAFGDSVSQPRSTSRSQVSPAEQESCKSPANRRRRFTDGPTLKTLAQQWATVFATLSHAWDVSHLLAVVFCECLVYLLRATMTITHKAPH